MESTLSEFDLHLFKEGTHSALYEKFGARMGVESAKSGARFALWAPNAEQVSVVGEFNGWDSKAHPLRMIHADSGVWEGFVSGAAKGQRYKFHIASRYHAYQVDKADPFALYAESAPATASVLWDLDYQWQDQSWMQARGARNALNAPHSVYELHLGSWRRRIEDGSRSLSYVELADELCDYVIRMGYTHVQFMPLTEHPFYGSWGYQTTGYFAPTSRYGSPQELMMLIDRLHQAGIGVNLDWVPSHFPGDQHGLAFFDGTHLFEHADPRQGFHPEWSSYIFNYGRNEVRSFLISSALFWLREYHVDGLRVDAVASMLYLDYSRKQGEWIPNRHGGRENLEAIQFLQTLNESAYAFDPNIQMIAEESTAWPQVSRPVWSGGLGFGMKWNMGWMHDTLKYLHQEPIHRKHHHGQLTFSLIYAFNENFMLPLSHDEVVHGKGSLLNKMPGDDWQRFANLRLLLAYMWTHPGKKLLFMGGDFGQQREWNHDSSLDWHLLEQSSHAGVQRLVADLNRLYREHTALHELDFDSAGFRWIEGGDADHSVLAYLRRGTRPSDELLIVANFTPVPRHHYAVGVPSSGHWQELLNSDASEYGGSGLGNGGDVSSRPLPAHGFYYSLRLSLPPLGLLILRATDEASMRTDPGAEL